MKILIAESIPCLNKGEEAILLGMVAMLREIPDSEIVYFTEYYEDDKIRYDKIVNKIYSEPLGLNPVEKILKHLSKGLKLLSAAIISYVLPKNWAQRIFPDALKEYLDADVLIIGHDNLYINKKRLFADAFIILFSRLSNIRLVSLGASVGPFVGNKIVTAVCGFLLNNFDLIMLREAKSKAYIDTLGVRKPRVEVTCDTAFLMPAIQNDHNQEIIRRIRMDRQKRKKKIVGLSFSRPLIKRFFSEIPAYNDKELFFIKEMVAFLNSVSSQLPVLFVVIDHVTGIVEGDYQDDRVLHDKICQKIDKEYFLRVYSDLTAQETKAIIAELDLLIASRTHAMIAAVSSSVDVIALSHQDNFKTIGIIGEICGLLNNIIFMENYNKEELFQIFMREISNIEKTKVLLKKKVSLLQQRILDVAQILRIL